MPPNIIEILITAIPDFFSAVVNILVTATPDFFSAVADIVVTATPQSGAGSSPFLFYSTIPLLAFGMWLFVIQPSRKRISVL